MLTTDEDIETTIKGILRSASLVQTCQFTGCDALELVDMDSDYILGQVVSRQMILILISGTEMKILLKIHFNDSEGNSLRRKKFPDQPTDAQLVTAKTVDYMKELTNQVSGRICRIFQLNNLSLGMCIPLNMHGFYELYTDYTAEDGMLKKFGQAWKIKGDFGSLVCTAYVEIMEPAAVTHLQYTEEQKTDDDELEFL